MDNKISLNVLAASLAQSTGKSKKLCEDFLKEFFKVTAESIESGEPLRIKGFGNFKIVDVEARSGVNVATGERQEIAAHRKVVFNPAKEMAAEINAPFEDFEAVEMDDELPNDFFLDPEDADEETTEDSVETSDEETAVVPGEEVADERGDENLIEPSILKAGSMEEGEDDDITSQAYRALENEKNTSPAFDTPLAPETHDPHIDQVVQPSAEQVAPQPEFYEEPEPQKSRFGMGFLVGALSTFALCAVIFMLGCFFDWWPVNFGNIKGLLSQEKDAQIETVVQPNEGNAATPDDGQAESEETQPEPVYDTVSTTRYLTTIARDHYGNFNFWPYIYFENESILGHPDRITPGTKVVVPQLSKYGVDPKNPDDIKAAKQKAVEIYARFKK